jgi:hypothetical protein
MLLQERTPAFFEYETAPTARYGQSRPFGDGLHPHPQLQALFAESKPGFDRSLRYALQFSTWFRQISLNPVSPDAIDPYWINGFLPPLDAITLYGFMVQFSPKLFLEIGSGNSTSFARRAIRDHQLHTTITSIDPMPRTSIDALCDEVIRMPLEKVDLATFDKLEPGDFLFIDGSHCALPNSDVTVLFLEILPRLRPGVIIHFHDISLPYDYPDSQIQSLYSEQYMLAVLLLYAAPRVELMQANAFSSNQPDLYSLVDPLWRSLGFGDAFITGSSLWLRLKN